MKAVIADDSPLMLDVCKRIMLKLGYEVVAECNDGSAAWKAIQEHKPDVAMLDYIMPNMTGGEVADAVEAAGLNTYVVLTTSMGQQAALKDRPHAIKPLTKMLVEMALAGAHGVH
jgi:two-component system nitrate/nitrite response regulator NarL